ncbi:MAG: hypothetical protein JWM40_960 [Frankiales bacterium]|nr:hypothetical protein [Frankiales bacterium]
MRRTSILVALLLTIASLGLATPAHAAPYGTFEGVVTDSKTGKPLAGIYVSSWRPDIQESRSSAYTDATGHWEFDEAPGPYQIMFTDGSGLHASTWAGGTSDQSTATTFIVAEDSRITVDAALRPFATVSGRITDTKGAPVVGLCPSFEDVDQGPGYGAGGACTDAQGRYTQGIEVPGRYKVRFAPWGTTYANQWYRSVSSEAMAKVLDVTATSVITGIDAVMKPQATITTALTDEKGNFLFGCVTAYDLDGGYAGNACSESDVAGPLTIPWLPAGSYVLQGEERWPYSHVSRYLGGSTTAQKATKVKVSTGDRKTVKPVVLPLGGSISGVLRDAVTGAPVSTACVTTNASFEFAYVVDGQPTEPGYACADADGSFTIRGLEAGSYKVHAVDAFGQHADAFLPSSPDSKDAKAYAVTLGRTTSAAGVLTVSGAVTGSVTVGADGYTCLAALSARTNERIGLGTCVYESGAYQLDHLGTNDYRIAVLSNTTGLPTTYYPGTVHVTAGSTTSGISFTG